MKQPVPTDAGLLIASGATVPTDATLGYQTGCIFAHTDGAEGTSFYINEGSYTSCDFNAVASLTAAQEALLGAVAGTVTASKAVIVDASKDASTFGNVGAATVTAPVWIATGTTGNQEIRLTANLADALSVEDTTGDLVVFDTTTNTLAIKVDKDCEVKIGASASVVGSGFPLDATRTAAMSVFTDDNNAAIGSGTLTRSGRFRSLLTYTGGNREQEAVGLIGQIVSVAGTNRHNMAGLMGSYEASTSLTVDGQASSTDPWIQAGVIGRVGVGTAITTINANGILAGVAAMSNTVSFAANNGTYCGFYAGAWSGAINFDYGLYVEPGEVNCGIAVGKFASSYATGSGLVFTATNTAVARFYGESTSDLTSAVNARVGVFRHLIVTASATVNHETYGLIGQCNVKNTTLAHLHSGLMGTFEVSTAATVNGAYDYGVGAVNARLGVGTSILTCTKPICAFSAIYNGGALVSGDSVAFAACSTTATNFTHFLAVADCDNILYAATGTDYENGVKITAISGLGATASGVLRVKVATTLYYIPLYAAGDLGGE